MRHVLCHKCCQLCHTLIMPAYRCVCMFMWWFVFLSETPGPSPLPLVPTSPLPTDVKSVVLKGNCFKASVRRGEGGGGNVTFDLSPYCVSSIWRVHPPTTHRCKSHRESWTVELCEPDAGVHLGWQSEQTTEYNRVLEERWARDRERPSHSAAGGWAVWAQTSASTSRVHYPIRYLHKMLF